jgi:hypothetical protein
VATKVSRFALGAVVPLISWFVVATLPTSPARAEDAQACPAAVAGDATPGVVSEASAQRLAAACGKPIEVLAAADETTKVVAEPSGGFSFESYAEPQRVERDSEWVDIDPNLVVSGDGKVRPVATSAQVVFSPGGDGPFASMTGAGATITLSWPHRLPPGVIAGDTITYPGVFTDVDLVVRATPGGFSHVLVVHSVRGAVIPEVRDTPYVLGGSAQVAVVGGQTVITGPDGVLALAPRAAAWDSAPAQPVTARSAGKPVAAAQAADPDVSMAGASPSTVLEPGDSANQADVEVRVQAGTLTVSAADALLDSPHFPIYIDPTYEKASAKWVPVSKLKPDTKWTTGKAYPRDSARVGSNFYNHPDVWRAHFQFDISKLNGKVITKTPSLDGYMTKTGWCAGEKLSVWETKAIDGNTATWDGMKGDWLHGKPLQTKVAKANGTCAKQTPTSIKFAGGAIKSKLQGHAKVGDDSISFGLRVPVESGGHWVKLDPKKVKLHAEYRSSPTSPQMTRMVPPGGKTCSKTSPGPWINDGTPTLYGKASDGDGTVRVTFDLTGATSPADYTSAAVKSGKEGQWTTPALADGANYKWRVRGTDAAYTTDKTDWAAGYCYFRMDHTPPTKPSVKRTSGTPVAGEPVELTVSSSDAGSGVKDFAYGLKADTKEEWQPRTDPTTIITFVPEIGRTVVYLWARDNAGNYSTRVEYNFFTGRITSADVVGAWRLNGDTRNDVDDTRDLQAGPGVAFGADRNGHTGVAATFSGTGCAETGPVVRSDAEFTVSGWVKLADKSANHTLIAQVGDQNAAFHVTYNAAQDRWEGALTSADSATPTWTVARATTATPVGAWQHVAVTVDPVVKLLRLYLDGNLAAETAIGSTTWNADGRLLIGCAGNARSTWNAMNGAIDNVGVWSGLLSDAQIRRAANELPAGLVARWAMRGTGTDATGHGYDATVPDPSADQPVPPDPEPTEPDEPDEPDPSGTSEPGTPTGPDPDDTPGTEEPDTPEPTDEPTQPPAPPAVSEPMWTDDQFGRTESAWRADGSGCATTAGPALRTDESFTVAAWAKLADATAANQTIIGQDGNRVSGWYLGARTVGGSPRWTFMMKAADTESSESQFANTADPMTASMNTWVHLVGAYDATDRTLTLYVNGRPAQTTTRTATPWHAAGSVTIGCARYAGVASDFFHGAVSDLRAWRGVLTAADVASLRGGNAPVTSEGTWALDGPGSDEPTLLTDSSGKGRTLTVTGTTAWATDRFAVRDGGLNLPVTPLSCAATAGPAIRTDASFTVAAWVLLEKASGEQTVLSQAGGQRGGFTLRYGASKKWEFGIPSGDAATGTMAAAVSDDPAVLGVWTHVAGVYDLAAGKVRLYVNGEQQHDADGPKAPWMANGPTLVGCTGTIDGRRQTPLGGTVDEVRVWTSTLDPDRIADLGTF